MKRFRGTLIAVIVLVVVLVLVWVVDSRLGTQVEPMETQPELFSFEKEDLTRILIERDDLTLELVRVDGEWTVPGHPWRPSRSMVRRVAHQLHDLTARARVVDDPADYTVYGLGDKAITVTIDLEDGESFKFEAGDPNPSSVSFYIRPLPGSSVYVVKKSAVDYYRLDLEQFREHRFSSLDADDADSIRATVDGRTLAFHRTGPKRWAMEEPETWDAAREEIRTILGRTGALKASDYVADQPDDLSPWGMDPPRATVRIGLSSGEVITLKVGDEIPETDPPECFIYREEDAAVYQARCGFLEAYQEELIQYRNRDILHLHEWDLSALTATRGEESLRVTRTSDGWRWPDDSPVPGSTPRRLAQRAAEFEAVAFHDEPPPAGTTGLDSPSAVIELVVEEDGSKHLVTLGGPAPDSPEGEGRVYALADDHTVVYELQSSISDVVDDLFREHGRKVERDSEKRIRDDVEDLEPVTPRERPERLLEGAKEEG